MFEIFFGRMCPLTLGHDRIISDMINRVGIENCLIMVGSCNAPLSFRVLFDYQTRRNWLKRIYGNELKVIGLPDYPHDDIQWNYALFDYITSITNSNELVFNVGSMEDSYGILTSYKKYFNGEVKCIVNKRDEIDYNNFNASMISATLVRDCLLKDIDIIDLVHPKIKSEIEAVFKKNIKRLDILKVQ
jgi:nicotinic acid mononucleotide adenylyltransferase